MQVVAATNEFGLDLKLTARVFNISIGSVKTIRRMLKQKGSVIKQASRSQYCLKQKLQQPNMGDQRWCALDQIARAIKTDTIPKATAETLAYLHPDLLIA